MSVEQNKAVVRRFHEELFNQKRFDIASEILSEEIECCQPDGRPILNGIDAYIGWMKRCFEVLPDYRIEYADLMGEGDKIAFRWTIHATHKAGEDWLFGPVEKDTKIEWFGVDVFHLSDGKIVRYFPAGSSRFVE